jgi:hypothetical protein
VCSVLLWTCNPRLFAGQEKNVLIVDNLNVHWSHEFQELCRKSASTLVWLLPPNITHVLQPVDAGYGAWIKRGARRIVEQYLFSEAVRPRALAGAVPAWERRVLITYAVGKAWAYANGKYNIRELFVKTGHAITVDGSGDDTICLRQMPDYHFTR